MAKVNPQALLVDKLLNECPALLSLQACNMDRNALFFAQPSLLAAAGDQHLGLAAPEGMQELFEQIPLRFWHSCAQAGVLDTGHHLEVVPDHQKAIFLQQFAQDRKLVLHRHLKKPVPQKSSHLIEDIFGAFYILTETDPQTSGCQSLGVGQPFDEPAGQGSLAHPGQAVQQNRRRGFSQAALQVHEQGRPCQ